MERPERIVAELSTRELLLHVLQSAIAAVDTSGATGIDQAQDFVFLDDQVITYNGLISISAPLPEDSGLSLSVKADRIYKTLQKMPDKDLEFGLGDDDNLLVTSKSTKVLLKSEPLEGDLAELLGSLNLNSLKEEDWESLPEGFDEGIALCLFGASMDKANVAYNCLRVQDHQISSTDNFRISRYTFPKAMAHMSFLVPCAHVKELTTRGLVEVQMQGTWVHFRDSKGLVFSARTIDVDFPEVDKFFGMPGKSTKLPSEIVKALDAVTVFSPGDLVEDKVAELHFKKGKVVCIAEDGKGRIERTVAMPDAEPPNISMLPINPVFFMEILKHTTTMKVAKGGERVLFKAGAFEHVMNLPE